MTDFTPSKLDALQIDNPAIHGLPPVGTAIGSIVVGAYDQRCDRAMLRYLDGSMSWVPACHILRLLKGERDRIEREQIEKAKQGEN
jgi:hypothetical protein